MEAGDEGRDIGDELRERRDLLDRVNNHIDGKLRYRIFACVIGTDISNCRDRDQITRDRVPPFADLPAKT